MRPWWYVLIVADIPALFAVSFRAIQQIGSCYRFDMEDPNMTPVVMSVFNVGSSASSAAKALVLMADEGGGENGYLRVFGGFLQSQEAALGFGL